LFGASAPAEWERFTWRRISRWTARWRSSCSCRNVGENPEELLKSIKAAGSHITSLREWLLVHAYQVQVLEKFGTDTTALRCYARDIVEPFAAHGHQPFVDWYRMATSLVRHVRFVFFKDETVPLDEILQKHLEEGILGERSIESVIVREDLSHMQLLHAPTVARMVREMLGTMA